MSSARSTLTLPSVLCFIFVFCCHFVSPEVRRVGEIDINVYREKVRQMFYHAYEGYLTHAYPYDELQPLTCAGHDTWGSYSLTLIDAMDTLIVMGNYTEFRRIAQILIDKGESFFDIDINVSVFETNIRIVGGLLSAHLMMKRAGMVLEPAWPCSGPLLRMADNIARKILPAFDTPTGMPYGTVNLRHGVPKGETTITCTACIGTFIIEFGALSRLTGDPIFEKTAIRAIRALWKYRSNLGLLGNHIDVSNGKWTAQDSGIGGGIDSYFEYLVKGAVMFKIPELLHMFREYEVSVKKYLKRDDWYMWAQMSKGTITLPLFTSLDGYWPSIKCMLGDIDEAMKTMHNFHQVWRQFGFTPEYYNIPKADVHGGREGYPLRPEIIESAMYLYQATKDPYLLEIGVDIVESIEHSARTSCGYATVKDVRDHRLEDRMESFFLAETTKYLYLLFDPDNFIHNNGSHGSIVNTPSGTCVIEAGGYIFNTEAHPIDLAAVHCCSAAKKEEDKLLQEFNDNLDLLSLLGLVDEGDNEWIEAEEKKLAAAEGLNNVDETISNTDNMKYDTDDDDTGVCNENGDNEDNSNLHIVTDDSRDEKNKDKKIKTDILAHHEKAKRKHHLHVVDMASFTEAERNLTRIFLEELKLDSIMKNISAQIAEKLKQQYKETEHERLAIDTARKIFEAGNESSVDSSADTSTTLPFSDSADKNNTTNVHDERNADENSRSDIQEREIKYTGGQIDSNQINAPSSNSEESGNDKGQVETDEIGFSDPMFKITVTKSDGTREILQQNYMQGTSQNNQKVVILQVGDSKEDSTSTDSTLPTSSVPDMKINTESDSPTVERFKSHIQLQLQHQENQNEEEEPQEPSTTSPALETSGPPSSLESKRTNLLSITAQIMKLFSRDGTSESRKGDDADNRTPSLANLYLSLSSYPLSYFHDPSALYCPAQPFHRKVSVCGEMFPDD